MEKALPQKFYGWRSKGSEKIYRDSPPLPPNREVVGELQASHPLDRAPLASSSLDLTPVYAVFYFKIFHFTGVENFLLSLCGLMRIYTKLLLPVFCNSACSKGWLFMYKSWTMPYSILTEGDRLQRALGPTTFTVKHVWFWCCVATVGSCLGFILSPQCTIRPTPHQALSSFFLSGFLPREWLWIVLF